MKTVLLIVSFLSAATIGSSYDKRMAHVVEQLRDLQEIGGAAVGYAGTPHDFYLLYRYSWYACTDQDLAEMLHDHSATVRLMGAKCLLTSTFRKVDRSLLNSLDSDTTKIVVGPSGCVFTEMTVADVMTALRKNPDYLGPREPRPNHTAEPVSPSRAGSP